MTEYEFQCPKCHRVFTRLRDPQQDPKRARCSQCRVEAQRIFSKTPFRIDWVNGPDGINLGTGVAHKSAREREYYAESHGLKKVT